jgi:flagellar biosynthesis component FlhA
VVDPIAVELGTALVPEDTSMEWSLFKELIPALRERISASFGIQIPGVRVRANAGDLPPTAYVFMLDEILLLRGQQEAGRRF